MVERFSGSALMQKRDDGLFVRFSDYAALEAQVQSLAQALNDAQRLLVRCHSRIHCLPRTSDTELAEQIDNMLGHIRETVR